VNPIGGWIVLEKQALSKWGRQGGYSAEASLWDRRAPARHSQDKYI